MSETIGFRPGSCMKATLYEALGIPQLASDQEVRAALRRLIRKYYAKTRDGQGNVEEALRFINHASRILSEPGQRRKYDQELAATTDADTEQRIAHFVSNVAATDQHATADDGVIAVGDDEENELALPDLSSDKNLHHPGLTERVASFGRSTLGQLALCALFGAFIAGAIVFVTPADAMLVAKQVLVWLTLTLLILSLIYGIVHGLTWMRRRRELPEQALIPQTDLAILNWRREKSVFLGTDAPQEDASWIFQLRMAELERAKAGRTSEPRPWNRLGARLFDYAIWGLVLALLLSALHSSGAVDDDTAFWIGHPLFAPILITLTWVPVEALLIASLQQTPGKWLFGVYLQFSISDAYARRDVRAQLQRALRRSFRVWWEGVACGFPLLAPILIAVCYEKLVQGGETDWDFAEDCLVTHSPPGVLNTVTGVVGLAAMLWLYGVAWHEPMAESITAARNAIVSWVPSPPTLLPRGFQGEVGKIGSIERMATTVSVAPPAFTGSANDADTTALFAERQARLGLLRGEGPRMLHAGNWRRAADLCRAWTELEFWSSEPWRCLGYALQAQGYHQEAINAFHKAAQYDPLDKSLDAAIEKSQRGIVADFLNRYRR
ncbi:MAG: tetratricopeptide repeat protein [Betaproteobacteria bacterium]|nr:MAG: tetratricopeptide repeat protein [Betaproteobacteria bacterium]